jgi:glycerol-3-phosphate dehydrogenase (NAD(P)+)
MSPLSRNRRAGELMAAGISWADAAKQLNGVAEGVDTVRGALQLAAERDVEMPIAQQVEAVVHGGRAPLEAVADLMSRVQKDELTGMRA